MVGVRPFLAAIPRQPRHLPAGALTPSPVAHAGGFPEAFRPAALIPLSDAEPQALSITRATSKTASLVWSYRYDNYFRTPATRRREAGV